jgi:hypothetical protein
MIPGDEYCVVDVILLTNHRSCYHRNSLRRAMALFDVIVIDQRDVVNKWALPCA